jgi:WD40 repeat protein
MTTLVGNSHMYQCCIFSNDTRLASTSFDETIRVWNIKTDPYSCVYVLNFDHFVTELLVSATHARIFAPILVGEMIRVWNANDGQCLPDIGNYTTNVCNSCVLFVDDDNQCIGYVNQQDEITLWNFMTNECTKRISIVYDGPKASYKIAYLSSKKLVWYIMNEKVGLYDFETDNQVYILSVKVTNVTVSENGKYLMIIRSHKNKDEFFLEVYWLQTGILK